MALMPQAPMGAPPMGAAPMGAPPMGGEGDDQAPAMQILPIVAMLAQQQQAAMMQQQQQEEMLKETMRQQLLRLVSMMPTANPAGVAARTEPMPMNMSPQDGSGMEDDTSGEEPVEPAGEMNTEYGYAG